MMKDTNAQINSLLSVTDELGEVLLQEIELLRTHRLHGIQELQPKKTVLGRTYESLLLELTRDPKNLIDLEPRRRAELREKMTRFDALVKENASHVRAAKEINERLLRAIADAAMRSQSDAGSYSEQGDLLPADQGRAISMAVDQRY